jgi:isocitrate/isopropylmalate dehydrogenase
MSLKYLGMPETAALIENGVKEALMRGIRTADLGGNHSTSGFGDELISIIENAVR